jgi:hypothetical protein
MIRIVFPPFVFGVRRKYRGIVLCGACSSLYSSCFFSSQTALLELLFRFAPARTPCYNATDFFVGSLRRGVQCFGVNLRFPERMQPAPFQILSCDRAVMEKR